MVQAVYRWILPSPVTLEPDVLAFGLRLGISERLLQLLCSRGVGEPAALTRFFGRPADALHDARLLPDAAAARARMERARHSGEKVMVYGDFDADGLCGLSILVLALRAIGVEAAGYVPERLSDGHGLSLRAIERARQENRTLIVTTDCGTSSEREIGVAAQQGIDVVVTDHHHAAVWPEGAVAVVNPLRTDSSYPDTDLTGAGVAWKVAQLLLSPDGVSITPELADLADLAIVGTVADVAPILGENRALAMLGLEAIKKGTRPGLAALLARAGVSAARLTTEDIAFAVAPRLNAAGRVGEAARAARLLLERDPDRARSLADEIEAANTERREVTTSALAQARQMLALESRDGAPAPDLPRAVVLRGDWPVGIIGLVAGRLADDTGRPAIVAAPLDPESGLLRASCRGPQDWNLAVAVAACQDLLVRHGGHAAAAGFDIHEDRWPEFTARFLELAAEAPAALSRQDLRLDLEVPAEEVTYALLRELARLEPTGSGNRVPALCLRGLRVVRARSARGGHTQLVLGRGRDVLDAVAFRRPDLATSLTEGERIDVVARAGSRSFGGFESIQLEILDVASPDTGRP